MNSMCSLSAFRKPHVDARVRLEALVDRVRGWTRRWLAYPSSRRAEFASELATMQLWLRDHGRRFDRISREVSRSEVGSLLVFLALILVTFLI